MWFGFIWSRKRAKSCFYGRGRERSVDTDVVNCLNRCGSSSFAVQVLYCVVCLLGT